ncbi:MAG TPA: phage Gp37/Gp68 family protein [Gemmatimonadaceae bacterium]|jgi:protein gp37|nr:phage Gp37/Gp68 family protein [Gemmatimonadaceae bacterium]
MTQKTGIEWTDSTWNPVTGCTQVSAGCDHCYALTLAHRLLSEQYRSRQPVNDTVEHRKDPFAVRLWPERLSDPLKWRESRMVFVNSMGDLFHSDVPDEFVRAVFDIMLEADHHIYQVLTKRPARMLRFLKKNLDLFSDGLVPSHIWLGTSIERQSVVYRVSHLQRVPASVRFLSCEPLLGPLHLDLTGIHWVIAGGESGVVHRPMDMAWARMVRDQCLAEGVPFFFKQVGGRTPKAGGRSLDGRLWDEFPGIAVLHA